MVRDEVSKGVRFGSMILAAMVAAVTGYRFIHAAHAAPPPPEITRPAAPSVPRPAPAPVPVPGAVSLKDTTVPPPPPAGAQAHRSRPAAPRPTPAPVAEAVITPAENLVEPEEKPVVPMAPAREEKPVIATDIIPPQSAPPPTEQPEDPKTQPRGKRVLKAVGHFLHISGKKDADPQSPRQQ